MSDDAKFILGIGLVIWRALFQGCRPLVKLGARAGRPLPGKAVSPKHEQARDSNKQDAAKACVLRCG
jgi:hypothetical protein